MIFETPPDDFNPLFETVFCIVEHEKRILLIRRLEGKSLGGLWGLPGGKVDKGETRKEAVLRELEEEVGLKISADVSPSVVRESVCVRHPRHDLLCSIYHVALSSPLEVVLDPQEHDDFSWVNLEKLPALELADDTDKCIAMYYSSNDSPCVI